MTKQLFSLPVEVTAVRFDSRGRSYPTRVSINGKYVTLEQSTTGDMISFHENGSYFWLTRKGQCWHIATATSIL